MIKGIDLSKHNGLVDFEAVKKDGIEFVIIRAGFGKSGEDDNFNRNIKEALRVGLRVGVYWFIYAKTSLDICYNVKMCDAVIQNFKGSITEGVWCDFEYDSDKYCGRQLSKNERTAWVKSFMDGLKSKGYDVGIYANPDYLKNRFNKLDGYKLWLAWYNADIDDVRAFKPILWQCMSNGKVNGVKGNVDINYIVSQVPEILHRKKGVIVTKGSNLMLRSMPDSTSKILKKIPNGSEITIVTKPQKNWWLIEFEGVTGYASSKYIKEV